MGKISEFAEIGELLNHRARVCTRASPAGYSYIFADGFRFPFGDYFDLTIDYLGRTQACWGEGYDYLTPGNVWYTRQLR